MASNKSIDVRSVRVKTGIWVNGMPIEATENPNTTIAITQSPEPKRLLTHRSVDASKVGSILFIAASSAILAIQVLPAVSTALGKFSASVIISAAAALIGTLSAVGSALIAKKKR